MSSGTNTSRSSGTTGTCTLLTTDALGTGTAGTGKNWLDVSWTRLLSVCAGIFSGTTRVLSVCVTVFSDSARVLPDSVNLLSGIDSIDTASLLTGTSNWLVSTGTTRPGAINSDGSIRLMVLVNSGFKIASGPWGRSMSSIGTGAGRGDGTGTPGAGSSGFRTEIGPWGRSMSSIGRGAGRGDGTGTGTGFGFTGSYPCP